MSAKVAEHLFILKDFGDGLLIRAYNVLKFEGVKGIEPELDKFLKVRNLELFILLQPSIIVFL